MSNESLGLITITSLAEATRADIDRICADDRICLDGLPRRVVAHLELLRGESAGMSVDRLEHSLQTATRAARAGESDEYILCALLHDIGDTLASYNHAELAAAILRPFVSKELTWMVEHHADFQTYYFFPHLGIDRDLRAEYAAHPQFDLTLEFCDAYDQVSFDPDYPTMPIEEFVPLVTDLMQRPRPDAADVVVSWAAADEAH
jgi:predicted HD phosphohydrolase